MKNKLLCWWALVTLVFLWLPVTAWAIDSPVGVAYRGHIQDRGDYPTDGSWIDSPEIIGTTGQSKRIEGLEIKLTGAVPAGLQNGMELRYNVHVQNMGWLYDEDDSTDWPKDGAYAGTRGDSLRIEAVKIVLTDSAGLPVPGYSVQYRGHVQNIGDLPADASQWLADGKQLGTVGSSLRLEALLVQVVKTGTEPVVYDAAGTYGPEQGSETIAGDVTVAADGVTLQNLVIAGNLTISEAVGDGTVTLNNVTVKGDTLVRGGGVHSIKINGGQYSRIIMEKTASGAVRIVATGVDGLPVVVSEAAAGETIILEGAFASVTVNAPNMTVTTQGATTTIGTLTVGADAGGTTLNLASGTTVTDLVLSGKAAVKGQGNVAKAEVNADGVVFEKKPGAYTVAPGVVIPPVFPNPGGGGIPSKTTLTISAPTITDTKVYDGNTSVAVTAGDLSGLATGDVGNVTVSATASYDNKNVGSGNKTIRVVYSLDGSAAARYNKPADFVINTGTITAKALTIVNPTLTTIKEYDGKTSAAVTPKTLDGVVGTDVVTVAAVASYDDATRATGKTITVVYTLGGGDAGNYTAPANYEVKNGEITKKQLTIVGDPIKTEKVYDGNNNCYFTGHCDFAGFVTNDYVGITPSACYDDFKAGDRTITITYILFGNDKDNYLAPVTETRAGKITQKLLTVESIGVYPDKVYDGNTTATVTKIGTLVGIVESEPVGIATTASYNDKTVGSGKLITVRYKLTGDAAVTANYSVQGSEAFPGIGTITARPLNITTAPTVTTAKMYDGKTTAAVTDNEVTDAIAGDKLTVTPKASYADATVNPSKDITIVYNLSGDDAGNYTPPANDTVTGEIARRNLICSINTDNPTKVYDQTTAAPVTASDLSGIVNNEDVSIASTSAYYDSKDVGTGKAVTVLATLTGDDSGNYQVEVPQPTGGVITAKPLEATSVTVTTEKEYDGLRAAAITGGGTVSGALTGETVSATPTASYDTKDADTGKPITVSFSLTGDAAVKKNYCAPVNQTITNGKITAKPLTISDPKPIPCKKFDGNNSAEVTAGTLVGVVSGETVKVTATATYENTLMGTGKTNTVVYTIDDTTGNYLPPADYTNSYGIIKKDIRVTSYNSDTSSWSSPVEVAGVTMTSLPDGYSIFDLDNTGNIYAGASDGSIKKYSGGSWSDTTVFSGSPPAGTFKFVGINLAGSPIGAFGVLTPDNQLYYNFGTSWSDHAVVSPTYQVLGAYSTDETSNCYIIIKEGNSLKQNDVIDYTYVMAPLAQTLPIIPENYSICGFNYTDGQLNMYLTR